MRRLFPLLLFIFSTITAITQPSTDSFTINKPVTLPCTPVRDQSMSSTCWSFASNSFIESEALRMGKPALDLSEIFTSRLIYLQKIRTHLELKGGNCFTPGGQFQDVQWVLENYGMVPENIYNGLKDGKTLHDHAELDTAIKEYVGQMLARHQQYASLADWQAINNLFTRYIGEVPKEFDYKGKKITPLQFLDQYVGFKPADYVVISSYSHHRWYEPFILENRYNWSSSQYLNVPLDDFIAITENALQNGYTVLWNGDVSDPGFDFNKGLALLNEPVTDLVNARQRSFADSSSYLDHVMHIVGRSTDSRGQRWYYIKNSWGQWGNAYGGYLYMHSGYFAIKTAAIVVHKDAIPLLIREKLKLESEDRRRKSED